MQIFPDDHQNQPANNNNNQRYNPSLLNYWGILIVVIYLNIFLFAIFVAPTNEISVACLLLIINGICLPSFFYYFNGKLRQFYLRQFWENAPNFLQPFNPDHIIEIDIPENNVELGPLPQNRYSKKRQVRALHPRKKRARF